MARSAAPAAALALATSLPAAVPAQPLRQALDSWRVASFLDDAGLSERTVWDLGFEAGGTAWCAASDGLYRYDGYQWRRFTTAEGLPSDFVRCLRVTRAGSLWIGTDNGAGTFDGERFERAPSESGVARRSVRRIVEEPDGTLWFCCDRWSERSAGGGLVRLRDGAWRTFGAADGLPADAVTDVVHDSRGRVFAISSQDVAQLEGERFSLPLEEFEGRVVWSLIERADGSLVALSFGSRYVWNEAEGWREEAGGTLGRLIHPVLLEAANGEVYTCTEGARAHFARVEGNELVPASASFSGASSEVRVLAQAPDGAVWAGGGNLLVRWQPEGGEWRAFPRHPLPRLCDTEGRLWFSEPSPLGLERGGVAHRLGGAWTELPAARRLLWPRAGAGEAAVLTAAGDLVDAAGEPEPGFGELGLVATYDLVQDGRGDVWALGRSRAGTFQVARRHDGRWRTEHLLEPDEAVARIERDGVEGVWLLVQGLRGDFRRLLRVTAGGSEEVELPSSVPRFTLVELLADRRGRLWVYGMSGLFCRERRGAEWRRIEEIPGRDVFGGVEREEDLWFGVTSETGGAGGLVRLRDGVWTHYPAIVRELVGRDPNGTLFYSTNQGLCIVPPGGRQPPSQLTVPTDLRVESAVLSRNGDLWIGLTDSEHGRTLARGALCYRPDRVPPETLAEAASETVTAGEPLTLDVRGIECFKPRSQRGHFRVSLRTVDGEWSRFEPLGREGIVLRDLPVGEHALFVRVQDEGLDVDPTPAAVRFEVFPVPLQARWWFWPAIGLIFTTIGTLAALAFVTKRRLARQASLLSDTVREQTAAIRVSERRYRNLFEQSHEAVYVTELDGTISAANGTALELLGFRLDELIGSSPGDLFIDSEDLEVLSADLDAHGSVRDRPCTVHTREGLPLEVRVTANLRRDQAGRPVGSQVLLRDVTTEKRLEERLRQTQKMEAVGRLAGGVAHDFNNLLTAIVGYGELLAAKTAGRTEVRRDVEMVLEAAQRAQALTGQIQTFSRGQIVEPRVIDLNEIVGGMEKLLRRIIGEDVVLSATLGEDLPPVRVDPGQLEQVIVNLAVNARDAMPEGGSLMLETSVVDLGEEAASQAELAPGRYVRFQVVDTGSGIDPSTRQKIFEPFFTTKERGKGSGLGLATVYGIVRHAGGGVDVHSLPGLGSTFRIYLPVCDEPAAVREHVVVPAEIGGGDETILVVEDEGAIRGLIERLLEDVGYYVLTASDAESALARARDYEGEIDLLLTDLVLPGRKGWELADELRTLRPGLGTLFMSGYAESERGDAARWQADEAVLKKPFLPSALRRRVREILDRRAEAPRPSASRANGRHAGDR